MIYKYKGTDGKEELRKALAEAEKEKYVKPKASAQEPTKPTKVHTLDDYWTIKNVTFDGVTKNYDLKASLLEANTQPQHLEYAENNPNDFIIRDLPFYHVLFKSIFDSGNTEAINFVKKSLNDSWILTGTSVKYKPGDLDEVVHNVTQNKIDVEFRDSDEWLKDANDENVYKALVGDTSDKIDDFYKKVNGKNSFLCRVSSKPKSLKECPVSLYSSSDRFVFLAIGCLYDSLCCFGVRG